MGVFLIAVAAWLARVEDWRSYTPLAGGGTVGGTAEQYVSEEKPSGVIRWLTTVDHKDIGMLYGAYALVAFAVGGLMVVLMRIELADPSMTLISNTFYNSLLTSHGITMLFLFGTPILAAFSNYFIPLLIGADDMAFPRINAIAFWLLPPAALLIWAGFFPIPDVIPAQTAWTMYTPLSAGAGSGNQVNAGVDLMLLGLHLSGVSATMGAINFIATIFTERDEKVSWANLDIFSWTVLTQSGLILFAFPLLGSAILMLLLDRNFGTMFFSVDGGAILWQHLFWFFGHPEVYILVLPPMGIVSLVLPRFAGRRLFGFKFVVYSTLAIGVLSFGVWAHHMFATGIDPRLRASFMAVSLAIAIPSAVKTFNWITTMWNGKIRLTTPMLFCIGFVSNFILGGVTGVFLASIPVDLVLHDTYYVVGHFHYIVMGAIAFAGFAGLYYWFPIYTGRMYQVTLGKWHFWLSMVGTNLTFFAMILLGYGGMPRRYATYLPQFATLHQVATVGALILLVGQMIFVWNFVQSWLEGRKVEDGDPWDLAADDLTTAEWTWFERKLETAVTDGGEDETELATDGGQTVDDADADANSADDA
ncbi:cbb3-type cytochrome c oxidase subunit I [Haloferax volcanii]|nr:cbb3-type cytochrome c oxidase subunit I [Haloferax volcanii]ELY26926.1 cox-type terminal oxidase subunit I [Haloferax volcanii DS2]MBS8120319.1 cbb3-type cytochrome c oxidase subunit I [Haloferax volcanii]MBS8125356.1 cbb3-type cytochrome c oxidase subunit I [Haloferax volcanii]MBS8129223.1 cbb3-type cytochrome c oxidase subunit I [Haloferax volcanii]MBS8133088.1 cbb3-type cytochrome c oxidase subunit I [Haloferax volcanii]